MNFASEIMRGSYKDVKCSLPWAVMGFRTLVCATVLLKVTIRFAQTLPEFCSAKLGGVLNRLVYTIKNKHGAVAPCLFFMG